MKTEAENTIKKFVKDYVLKNDGEQIDNDRVEYSFQWETIETDTNVIVFDGYVSFPILSVREYTDTPKEIDIRYNSEFEGEYTIFTLGMEEELQTNEINFKIEL